jgi:hypothetical protein
LNKAIYGNLFIIKNNSSSSVFSISVPFHFVAACAVLDQNEPKNQGRVIKLKRKSFPQVNLLPRRFILKGYLRCCYRGLKT